MGLAMAMARAKMIPAVMDRAQCREMASNGFGWREVEAEGQLRGTETP